ncbi:MAG: glycosyltransferase family 2 protein [Lachnospiraceae bacterium]|jgi:glycosyltransferase involved in cell wall biosynthesis|nr:glycosyltransferase family 2 protein [Lachnospiraceae bacterium]
MLSDQVLYVVIPCYNEQEVLAETAARLKDKMNSLIGSHKISVHSRVAFVNDGSKDDTWSLIEELHKSDPLFSGINLSRNRGHQNALLAGLMTVKECADVVISMDADLQDDIDAMDEMIDKYLKGIDIVYGVRRDRTKDSFFKKVTAEGFYRLMNVMGANTVFNHADYRLMSRRALEGLAEFSEVNLFLRGIIPMIGYANDVVYYKRGERFAGESKYPFRKMLAFAIEGITSLSTRPIKMITGLGFMSFLVIIGILIYSIVRYYMGETITGWPTLMVSVWLIGGLILLSLGVVGEYVGKIYLEAKGRPRFIIESFINESKDTPNQNHREEKDKND